MTEPRLEPVTSGPLPYLVSVPEMERSDGSPHPVLCFLHGHDEGPPTPLREGITRHGPLRPSSSALASSDFVVVAPQLPARGDLWHRHADAVLEIVRGVQAQHGGDAARTYLTGFSFGGNGVFDLALAHPGAWAALWSVDPTRVPAADPGRPVWLSSGAISRGAESAFVRRLLLRRGGSIEGEDRVILDEGEDHVGTATRAYADDRIFQWLLSKRLPPDR